MKFQSLLLMLALLLSPLSLFSVESLDDNSIDKSLNVNAVINKQDVSTVTLEGVNKNSDSTSSIKFNEDNYEDIALLNYVTRFDKENNKKLFINKTNGSLFADNVGAYNTKIEKRKAELLEEQAREKEKTNEIVDTLVYISGYCSTTYVLEVEKLQAYNLLDCVFSENDLGINSANLMAMFAPITQRSALIAKPIYLSYGTKKIPIDNGIILTADRTSLNVANFINDKKLKKLSGEIISNTGEIALNNSIAFLEQQEKSNTTQSIVSESSVSGTTTNVSSNTTAPSGDTYLINTAIQFLSSLVKAGGILLSEDSHPLFKVYANEQFYVDFTVKLSKQTLKDIDYFKDYYKDNNNPISVGQYMNNKTLNIDTKAISITK